MDLRENQGILDFQENKVQTDLQASWASPRDPRELLVILDTLVCQDPRATRGPREKMESPAGQDLMDIPD